MKRNKYNGIFAYKCDIGKIRKTNEDQVMGFVNFSNDVLLFVADGMGGHKKGDFASETIKEFLERDFKAKDKFLSVLNAYFWLIKEVKAINKYIFRTQDFDENYKGCGTTLCLALIHKDKIIILNAGDSRCYFLVDGKLVQKTEDQTYVNYLLRSGQISSKEAETHPKKHYLINAIGLFPTVSFDINIYEYHGESVFLCSDGLYNNVDKKDIEATLNNKNTVDEKINSLVSLANFNGGSDNISAILWESNND